VWLGVAAAVMVAGIAHAELAGPPQHAVTPVQVIAAPAPAEAYLCAVRCPGYVEPADGPTTMAEARAMAEAQRADAGYWTAHKGVGVVPPNGPVIVTQYVPVPAAGQQATVQPKASKATSTRATAQPKAAKAPKAPAASKAPKQAQPSTTVTSKQSTRTTATGTVTVTNSTTTTTKG